MASGGFNFLGFPALPRSILSRHGLRGSRLNLKYGARLPESLLPLIPFVMRLTNAFAVAAVATGFAFALIGAPKSRWSVRPWWRSALETLAVGGGAATVAYGISSGIRGFADFRAERLERKKGVNITELLGRAK